MKTRLMMTPTRLGRGAFPQIQIEPHPKTVTLPSRMANLLKWEADSVTRLKRVHALNSRKDSQRSGPQKEGSTNCHHLDSPDL
jgi:hypothetical protein